MKRPADPKTEPRQLFLRPARSAPRESGRFLPLFDASGTNEDARHEKRYRFRLAARDESKQIRDGLHLGTETEESGRHFSAAGRDTFNKYNL